MVVSRERGGAVLVTGATGGIGRAVVHTLHAAGWDVALLDLAEEPLRALAAELDERRPGSASFTAADAAEESDVAAWVEKALICCRLACEPMIAQGAGSIVNFASTAGEYGSISPAAHYAAAKGAVIALTKSLARELSPRGIRVNAISPGPVDTVGLTAGSSATSDETAARTLLGRLGTPQEIADGVAFLVSDESSFITGHVLRVNGGSLL
jgi:NAD(P)-dependent dehydrogenase (short-subunit alcohol dehydrogenase family)